LSNFMMAFGWRFYFLGMALVWINNLKPHKWGSEVTEARNQIGRFWQLIIF
jgi:hypothetical protein